jgi:hydroxyethylthiazole kinase-like uncharacterized protein yjeF
MKPLVLSDIKSIYLPPPDSHKGQNGKLLIIGGSHLFHAASLWSLTVASRIVDLVHYASVPENNEIVEQIKVEFRNGIVVSRDHIDDYIQEDDCILIGTGMTRDEETKNLTDQLLKAYPNKQWVIDAGALQMMDLSLIPEHAILTPHHGEFEGVWGKAVNNQLSAFNNIELLEERVRKFSEKFQCVVLVKGEKDIISENGGECWEVSGGNAGMTKGGTGDVLAGLIAALATKNDPIQATLAGSLINKVAGDELFKTVGPFFNATDLANQIPKTMKQLFI